MKNVYRNGLLTCSILTDEETKHYSDMPAGVAQTCDMIRCVAENEEEKQILEITSNGVNRILIPTGKQRVRKG